jgi:hypothetical protein
LTTDKGRVYRGPSQAGPGNDIHAVITKPQKPPTRGPASLGLSNLAGLLTETNRHAEAEPLYRRALAIFEKSFGRQQSFAVRFRLGRMEPLGRRVMMPATRSS